MRTSLPEPPSVSLACSVAAVASGLTIDALLESPVATLPALLLVALGLAGVASRVADLSADRIGVAARRWWLAAFVAFLPYGLAASPSSESAAAVGEGLSGPVTGGLLEAAAGAAVLCAITVTVLYGFAAYGIHPGAPTPEERVLED